MDEKELEEKRQAIMKKNGKYRVRWVHDGIVLTRMLIQKKIISIIIIIIIIIKYQSYNISVLYILKGGGGGGPTDL